VGEVLSGITTAATGRVAAEAVVYRCIMSTQCGGAASGQEGGRGEYIQVRYEQKCRDTRRFLLPGETLVPLSAQLEQ
jgi:hypothetical protein